VGLHQIKKILHSKKKQKQNKTKKQNKKKHINNVKRKPTKWEIFANHIPDEGLTSKTYKKLL